MARYRTHERQSTAAQDAADEAPFAADLEIILKPDDWPHCLLTLTSRDGRGRHAYLADGPDARGRLKIYGSHVHFPFETNPCTVYDDVNALLAEWSVDYGNL